MPILEETLLPGENIVYQTRPHWVALLKEFLYSLALLALFLIFVLWWDWFNGGWVLWPALVIWLFLVTKGGLEWYSTTFALTDHRVLFRRGVFSKKGYEIPVEVIQDVGYRQSMIQRMFNVGDLVLMTSASTGRTAISNLPDPVGAQNQVSSVREKRIQGLNQPPPMPAASNISAAEQLEILSGLHNQGKLTDEEFETQKRRLLGGS